MFEKIKAAMFEQLEAGLWYINEKIQSFTWHAIDYTFSAMHFKIAVNEDTADPEIVQIVRNYMPRAGVLIRDSETALIEDTKSSTPPQEESKKSSDICLQQPLQNLTPMPSGDTAKFHSVVLADSQLGPQEAKEKKRVSPSAQPTKLPPEVKTNAMLAKEYFIQKKYDDAFKASLTAIAEDDKDEGSRIIFIESVVKTNKTQFAKKAVIELAKFTISNNPKHLLILAILCNMTDEINDRNIHLMALFHIDLTQLPGNMGTEIRDETLAFLKKLAGQPKDFIKDYKDDLQYYYRGEMSLKKGDLIKASLDFSCAIWLNLQDNAKALPVVYLEKRRDAYALMSNSKALKYAEKDHMDIMALYPAHEKNTPARKKGLQKKNGLVFKDLTLQGDQQAKDFSSLLLKVARECIERKDNEAASIYLERAEKHFPRNGFRNIFDREVAECRKLLTLNTQSATPKNSADAEKNVRPNPSDEMKSAAKPKRNKKQAVQEKKEKNRSAQQNREKNAAITLNLKYQKLQESMAEDAKKMELKKINQAAKAKAKNEAHQKRIEAERAAEEKRLNELARQQAEEKAREDARISEEKAKEIAKKTEEKAQQDARIAAEKAKEATKKIEEKAKEDARKAEEKIRKEKEAKLRAAKLKQEAEEKEQKAKAAAKAAEEKAKKENYEKQLDDLSHALIKQTILQSVTELKQEADLIKQTMESEKIFDGIIDDAVTDFIQKVAEAKAREEKEATSSTIQLRDFEENILNLLEAKFANVKLVGSSVSGRLRTGQIDPAKDVDIVTTATRDQILNLKEYGFHFSPSPDQEGLFQCDYKGTKIDIWQSDALKESLKKDAKSRDFTINALYADAKGKVYDPTGKGLDDLKNGIISSISHPQDSFNDDPLRILRAIGMTVGTGYRLDDRKKWFLKSKSNNNSPQLISMKETIENWQFTFSDKKDAKNNPGRFNSWLLKALTGNKATEYLQALSDNQIIDKLFTQITPGITHNINWLNKQLSADSATQTKVHPLTKIYTNFLVCSFMNNQWNLTEGFNFIFNNPLLRNHFQSIPLNEFADYYNEVVAQWKKDFLGQQNEVKLEQTTITLDSSQKIDIQNLIQHDFNFGHFDWGLASIAEYPETRKLKLQHFYELHIPKCQFLPVSSKGDPRLFRNSYQDAPHFRNQKTNSFPHGRLQNQVF